MKILDLCGTWRCRTDEAACFTAPDGRWEGSPFVLPGPACENGIGTPLHYTGETDPDTLRAPRQRYAYLAPLWLQREVDIPADFAGQAVTLFLERVNMASRLWVDDLEIGRQIVELSAPHIYDLTGKLTPGRHTLTLRLDNRDLLSLGDMASGYSPDTQDYWIGVVGRIELQICPPCHVADVQVYPAADSVRVRVVTACNVHSPERQDSGTLRFQIADTDGGIVAEQQNSVRLFTSKQVNYFTLPLPNAHHWNEFTPTQYTLVTEFRCGDDVDCTETKFGMRCIAVQDKKFYLDGRQISLRGTIDCAQFPLTGYPAMDKDAWLQRLGTAKEYGLNHIRFHAWCPPEAAFAAADELGLYLSVEMPLWLNRDVHVPEVGDDPAHRSYFLQEALNISRAYGNHPSFLFFSNGNENLGDFSLLEEITTAVKAIDPRRLYTLTSNFDHPLLPCEDYLCAFRAAGHPVRIQHCQDRAAEDTALDYADAVADTPVPVISFEVGQYCVYPDTDCIADYSGAMRPINFEAVRKLAQQSGVHEKRQAYIDASGNLAAKLYKEDIEAALRTRDFGGFELLSLTDYTGQKTATVGLLDVFGRSKGILTADEFRRFAGPVVPLFKAKRIFTTTEFLDAALSLYDFGPEPTQDLCYDVTIREGNAVFCHIKTRKPMLHIPLSSLDHSAQLDVTVAVGIYSNSWRIFVFADTPDTALPTVHTPAELEKICETGGRALVPRELFSEQIPCNFIPVFWSPVFFPSKASCGVMINAAHPALQGFPTGAYADYQWKELLENAVAFCIPKNDKAVQPLLENVPNFYDNTPTTPLAVVHKGKATLLYCGFDLTPDTPAVRQLKNSLGCFLSGKA